MKKQDSESRIANLQQDLEDMLSNPRADEILSNGWFYDGTLPIPSGPLLELLCVQLLHDWGRFEWFAMAGSSGVTETIHAYIGQARSHSDEVKRDLVAMSVARMNLFSFSFGIEPKMLVWWLVKISLCSEEMEGTALEIGRRRLVRFMLEALSLRAFFLHGVPVLEGLSGFSRVEARFLEAHKTSAQIVATKMFYWLPFLQSKLGKAPSFTEMKEFLLGLFPRLTTNKGTWSEARREYYCWKVPIWSWKIDKDQIGRIVNAGSLRDFDSNFGNRDRRLMFRVFGDSCRANQIP